ncbi:kinase-like domain-containing protein [Phaeosphaeriaceae sp. PMI808]|nr:kinase-like domain-containing protein [Phaeosphaeriaceae sp. PMI808]
MAIPGVQDAVFATLVPCNNWSRYAFDAAYDPSQRHRHIIMQAEDEKIFDREVFDLQQSLAKENLGESNGESTTEADTPAPEDISCTKIWRGFYGLSLDLFPSTPNLGWTVGTTGAFDPSKRPDIPLGRATQPGLKDVQGRHFHFVFDQQTGFVQIISSVRMRHAPLSVDDGPHLTRNSTTNKEVLNKPKSLIRIGNLQYRFEYTVYAQSGDYIDARREFCRSTGQVDATAFSALTPTPSGASTVYGQWTVHVAIAQGTCGKVFSATNSRGKLVAVKRLSAKVSTARTIERERRSLERLTALSNEQNFSRIVKLIEVIDVGGATSPDKDYVFVLSPLCQSTLDQYIKSEKQRLGGNISNKTLEIFHSVLQGIGFLHSHRWLHGDIKPVNIGMDPFIGPGWPPTIILDLGCCEQIPEGSQRSATPGHGGTVHYLAPEREMGPHGLGIGVWSLAVIGIELLGYSHPWAFAKNPWRHGTEFEYLRSQWLRRYDEMIAALKLETVGPWPRRNQRMY